MTASARSAEEDEVEMEEHDLLRMKKKVVKKNTKKCKAYKNKRKQIKARCLKIKQ